MIFQDEKEHCILTFCSSPLHSLCMAMQGWLNEGLGGGEEGSYSA